MTKVGTYKGKIYLNGMEDGRGEIELQVMLHHAWYWAVAAILSGIGDCVLGQLFTDKWRLVWLLIRRWNAIRNNYIVATKQFKEKNPGFKFSFPEETDEGKKQLDDQFTDYNNALGKYRRKNLFF